MTASTGLVLVAGSAHARSSPCAPTASTSCRSVRRSAKPISSRPSARTRRLPAIWPHCSTRASIPAQTDAARGAAGRAEARITEQLNHVASLDQDRILRRYLELIKATLRTNAWQPDADRRGSRTTSLTSSTRTRCPSCRRRGRRTRSSSTRPMSRACICAAARSRAAACAGPTGARISVPRSWA